MLPGSGRTSQQACRRTVSSSGRTVYAWLYLDGERYTGTPGAYDDQVPARDSGR